MEFEVVRIENGFYARWVLICRHEGRRYGAPYKSGIIVPWRHAPSDAEIEAAKNDILSTIGPPLIAQAIVDALMS